MNDHNAHMISRVYGDRPMPPVLERLVDQAELRSNQIQAGNLLPQTVAVLIAIADVLHECGAKVPKLGKDAKCEPAAAGG